MRHGWVMVLGMLLIPALAAGRTSTDDVKRMFGNKARVTWHRTGDRVRMLAGLDAVTDGAQPAERAQQFLDRHAAFLGLASRDLMADAPVVSRSNVRVRLQQMHQGVVVFGRDVVVRFDATGTRVRSVTLNIADLKDLRSPATDIGTEGAVATARAHLKGMPTDAAPRVSKVILPGAPPVFAYRVVAPSVMPMGRQAVFVDMETGRVRWVRPSGIE